MNNHRILFPWGQPMAGLCTCPGNAVHKIKNTCVSSIHDQLAAAWTGMDSGKEFWGRLCSIFDGTFLNLS